MNTTLLRLGFLLLLVSSILSFTSCENEEEAHATVCVLQEFTATQGQVNQLVPVPNVQVRFYVGIPRTEHIDAIVITDLNGEADYTYEYQARIYCDVTTTDGVTHGPFVVKLDVGKSQKTEVILPE